MKNEKYDIVIDTRSTIKTLLFSLYSLSTPFRIGRKKQYNRFFQNYRIDNKFDGIRDNSQLTLSLLDPLSKKYNIIKDPIFKLYYTTEEFSAYKNYMKSEGIDFSKPIIICAVTARLKHKVWDMTKMKKILEKIIQKYDAQLIFNYGDKIEKEACGELASTMNNDSHIFTNIEAKNLRELVCLLANSNFFFGNEGGPRHISQALNIPSFAIYPPNIPKTNWLPNKSTRFQGIEFKDIINKEQEANQLSYIDRFNLIDVDSVWKMLDNMLKSYIK